MATLNTLRTKYGIVLSVLIAIVLLAFILGDQLSYRGNQQEMVDEVVMTIAGEEIKASEYAQLSAYLHDVLRNSGASQDQIDNLVSNTFVYNNYTAPAIAEIGLSVGEAEIDAYAVEFGQRVAAQLQQYGWPADQIEPMVRYQWELETLTVEQMLAQQKLMALFGAANYVNRLEVEQQLREENLTFDGRYTMVPYTAAGEVEVSEEEIEAYYQAHREENPSFGSRTLRYVTFAVEATDEDKAAVEKSIMDVNKAVAEANGDVEAIKRAVRAIGGKADSYKLHSSLDAKVADALKAKKQYGPVLEQGKWNATYLLSDVTAPATFDFEVAVVNNVMEANELVAELEANGGDFAKLATAVDTDTDSRAMTEMSNAEAKNFIGKKVGDIFTYTYNHKPAVVKITAVGEKQRFVLTADVEKSVVASEDTRSRIASEVDTFVKNAGESVESFNEAANAAGYQVLATTANRNDYNPNYGMGRNVRGIANSRNIAVWGYNAEVGAIRSFHIGDVIYVAMVSAIDNNEYKVKNASQIERTLKHDKQFAMLESQLALDAAIEGAQSGKFEGVKFSANSVDGKYEQALVGAIAATRELGVAKIVKGQNGAFVFVVDAINGDVDAAEERTPLMTQRESVMGQMGASALIYKADIQDNRGEGQL
ncbi:MAG: SurA N-terminal domain-containing protein [Alistipes sp.]|nr:SurA N-terminal domain-containing protein [Alistipes sp.]